MSVALTYKSVSITLSIRNTVTSKKLIEVFDHSAVSLMVGCTLLILSVNEFNLFSPCFHKKNISSMFRHDKYGLYSDYFVISSFSSAIKKMPYGGAKFLPIAVPCFYLSVFFPNENMLFFYTTSAKPVMVSIETYFLFRVSSCFLNADKPSSCGIFGYNPTTSIVHKIMPSGNFGRERSFLRNSLVSLI